jgi:predicted nucleotidyltransferase
MKNDDKIRDMIAREAARLMYEDGVREYRDAKRKAAKPFGPEKSLSLGSHLPGNAEIHEELARLIAATEKEQHPKRLLEMRMTALRLLELFEDFSPYLVGSVLSGAVTSRSDIDLHLFADSLEEVERLLDRHGIPFETETVSIRKGGAVTDYLHVYLEDRGTQIECSVYPTRERRNRTVSSITGKPMERASAARLKKIIAQSMGREEPNE